MTERGPGLSHPTVDGLVIVDKPSGWTSHDAVARCRKVFHQRRVGHAGTLDPDATGILLIGLGRATRLLQFLVGLPKSYTAEVVLGVATTTLDAAGEVTGQWEMGHVTLAEARAAAASLTGTLAQVPPMVSAIHVGGRRLHELARAGVEVEREARTVVVTRFDVTGFAGAAATGRRAGPDGSDRAGAAATGPGATPDGPGPTRGPVLAIEVDCSSGTYIRSLAADLGAALGGGAHLRKLRRTAVGPWTLADAMPLDDVSPERVLPPAAALAGLPSLIAPEALIAAIGHGKVLDRSELSADGPGPWAVLGPDGALLAVYQAHHETRIKPVVVVAEAAPSRGLAGPPPPSPPSTP
jgi:tRNA pseudouridine55 synthase